MKTAFKIGITGTRSGGTLPQLGSLANLLQGIVTRESTIELHHGDCEGVDVQAAIFASKMGIHTVCHPPVDESHRANHESDTILPQQTHFARNRNIVDTCDLLIVIPYQDEWQSLGGTWYTHDYAIKKGVPVMIIQINGTTREGDAISGSGAAEIEENNDERIGRKWQYVEDNIDERIERLEAENERLQECWKTLFKILDTVEVNENGKEIRPTTIRSCRVAHTEKLRELFAEVRDCLKENYDEG